MNLREPSIHMLLCLVAIIAGVLIFANVLHVDNLHEGVGVLLAALGLLLLV